MTRIYLDSNVLVAYHAPDEAENGNRGQVENALSVFEGLRDIELCTSMWAVAETVKILVRTKQLDRGLVAGIADAFHRRKRLGSFKVCFVDVSPQENYDFDDFFWDLGDGLLSYRSHLADVMHSVIMKNNGIMHILTFDQKRDFQIPGLIVLHPENITLQGSLTGNPQLKNQQEQ